MRWVALLLVVAGCASYQQPINPNGAIDKSCPTEQVNPKRYQALRTNQAVRAASYYEVRDANLRCANALADAAHKNAQAARYNEAIGKREFWTGARVGAVVLLVLEILVYVAAL